VDRLNCADFNAKTCQSCAWIETPYPIQLANKQAQAAAALPAHVSWLAPVPSALAGFRNKAKMVAGGRADALILGIQLPNGLVQELAHCPLYPPAISNALALVRTWLQSIPIAPYSLITRAGELKFVLLSANPSGELMLRLVLRSKTAIAQIQRQMPALYQQLPALKVLSVNIHPEHKAVLEGAEEIVLSTIAELALSINRLTLQLRPQSFFQTNTAIAAQLYQRAIGWLSDAKVHASIVDLYCGVGGFALHAAAALPNSKVLGVELSASAIAAASDAARAMQLSNASFVCADATAIKSRRLGDTADNSEQPVDAVIVNPPRRGLGAALCQCLEQSGAKLLIYSSCNIDSLRTDLQHLPSFRATDAQLLDMFAHTPHFEVIVRLERNSI
jgi:23S rRNA (uracil747-C5)-methyltransferase